jgi:hypothetical protein
MLQAHDSQAALVSVRKLLGQLRAARATHLDFATPKEVSATLKKTVAALAREPEKLRQLRGFARSTADRAIWALAHKSGRFPAGDSSSFAIGRVPELIEFLRGEIAQLSHTRANPRTNELRRFAIRLAFKTWCEFRRPRGHGRNTFLCRALDLANIPHPDPHHTKEMLALLPPKLVP